MTPTCTTCQRPYTTPHGCIPDPDRTHVPYGSEPWWEVDFAPAPACRDCGTPVGQLHHTACCVEICGTCRGQRLCCDCTEPAMEGAEP